MILDKPQVIKSAPTSYSDWLDCFEILQNRNVSKEELKLLSMGECVGSASSIGFLEEQLIKTINLMIKRYIKTFNKELQMYMSYNDYDNLTQLFINLANRFRNCMFFVELEFMSKKFRTELQESVESEINKFWDSMINSIYSLCMEQNNSFLEDELFIIRRIKLFK